MVARAEPGGVFDTLLFPTDGSDCATAALETGLDVAAVDGVTPIYPLARSE